MFVVREMAASAVEADAIGSFDSAAEAYYYMLKHMRKRFRRRGYDERSGAYWGQRSGDMERTYFVVDVANNQDGLRSV